MALLDPSEETTELTTAENQNDVIAIIEYIGNPNGDSVLRTIQQRAWSDASAVVKSTLAELPDWYLCLDLLDVDRRTAPRSSSSSSSAQ